MKERKKLRIASYILILIGLLVLNHYMRQSNNDDENKTENTELTTFSQPTTPSIEKESKQNKKIKSSSIDELTSENIVVSYLKESGELPEYYITKKEARNKGWIASEGNLCDVLPGKAIGGDHFSNREKQLPAKKGRSWYEADLNYNCGRRNADRLLYSSDGLIFVTYDHYKTFEKR